MTEICQNTLRFAPWMSAQSRRLPGIMPLQMDDWLQVDEVYAAQVNHKAELLRSEGDAVLRITREAEDAGRELLDLVLAELDRHPKFDIAGDNVNTPDGRDVWVDRSDPLRSLSQLTQEDICILQKHREEHVLTGAVLCFPASWSLAEKFERPLIAIHSPVASYTGEIAKRVQRLFDAVKPARPLWRANALRYADPELYQPRTLQEDRERPTQGGYIRSERQSILKLPETGACVFSIHTTVIPASALTQAQATALAEHPIHTVSEPA